MEMNKVLQNQEKVKNAFEKYTESLKKVEERRNLWNSETKIKIIETLTLVEQTFKFGWHVHKIENMDNYQTVNIQCSNVHSGIIENDIDFASGKITKRKVYRKEGGYLSYCQSYIGKIHVIIGIPFIEELVTPKNSHEVIATIERQDLTEDIITSHVITFLEKLQEFESIDITQIGYKLPSQN